MKDFSYLTHSHPSFVENLYKDFLKDPETVDPEFRKFFEGFDFAQTFTVSNGEKVTDVNGIESFDSTQLIKEFSVFNLISSYRRKGHLISNTNPIRERINRGANLELKYFGLSDNDLETEFEAGKYLGLGKVKLKNILDRLTTIYASHIGFEYNAVINQEKIDWLENEIEKTIPQPISIDKKKRILEKLNQGVRCFETK